MQNPRLLPTKNDESGTFRVSYCNLPGFSKRTEYVVIDPVSSTCLSYLFVPSWGKPGCENSLLSEDERKDYLSPKGERMWVTRFIFSLGPCCNHGPSFVREGPLDSITLQSGVIFPWLHDLTQRCISSSTESAGVLATLSNHILCSV